MQTPDRYSIEANALYPACWNLLRISDGATLIEGESFEVASGVLDSIRRGGEGCSELDEVARVILAAEPKQGGSQ